MALRLILFNLTLVLADQGLFRKFQVSQYDLVETSKWAYTRIDCAGFCLAQPQCHGFIYENGLTCTAITNMVIVENGPIEAWIVMIVSRPKKAFTVTRYLSTGISLPLGIVKLNVNKSMFAGTGFTIVIRNIAF